MATMGAIWLPLVHTWDTNHWSIMKTPTSGSILQYKCMHTSTNRESMSWKKKKDHPYISQIRRPSPQSFLDSFGEHGSDGHYKSKRIMKKKWSVMRRKTKQQQKSSILINNWNVKKQLTLLATSHVIDKVAFRSGNGLLSQRLLQHISQQVGRNAQILQVRQVAVSPVGRSILRDVLGGKSSSRHFICDVSG